MNQKHFDEILERQEDAYHWLLSLITDPTGKRYLVDKSPSVRQLDNEKQIQRTAALLDFFDNPQNKYQSIHIAGTGGKGSVTTMIGAILTGVGFKVGVYTSPYLQVPNEKLLINGKMIPPSKFASLIEKFRERLIVFVASHPDLTPQYSEAWVALTHLYFASERVDWGIIETGMGGRFDPTNVLTPDVSVITNVDFDHVPQLGTTLREIAFHKAGIIKNGKPIVTSEKKEEPLSVIQQEAEIMHAPVYQAGKDFTFDVVSQTELGSIIGVATPDATYHNISISLPGTYQPENAATAITAVDLLKKQYKIPVTGETISKALQSVTFPGRMEKVQEYPKVILDGAHNPQKMRALARSLREMFGDKPVTLIVGMLSTKDAKHSLDPVLEHVDKIIATAPHVLGKPSTTPEHLKDLIKEINPRKPVITQDTVLDAIQYCLDGAHPDDIIVVTGSLYMLGEARNRWFPYKNMLLEAEYET